MMIIQRTLIVIFLLTFVNLYAQEISESKLDSLRKILYQYANEDSPGLALGIVKDGQVVYENYLGLANLEHKINIDQNTRFSIASNAKQFTALCILKLMEAGKVKLEDDIRKYLPDLYKSIPDRITIAQLINHSSGTRDYGELWGLQGRTWYEEFLNNKDVIALLKDQTALNFKPGTDHLYSNTNYILLAEIVKKVSGQKFSAFAKALFEALGMPGSSFQTNYMDIIPFKARPYAKWNTWKEYPSISGLHADGALFTTLRDQLQWEQIVQNNNGKYLSQALINKSQQPLESQIKTYGYGLEFRNLDGLDYTYHDGSSGAYKATFLRFPTKKLSIVIMGNNENVPSNSVAWQVATLLLDLEEKKNEQRYPADPDKIEALKSLKDVLGIYQAEADGTLIRIVEKGGALYRELYRRDPVRLIQQQGGLFEYEPEDFKGLKMNFRNIGQADQNFTLYLSSLKPRTYQKVSNLTMNNFDKSELEGRFFNDETDTEIILKYEEGNTFTLTKNGRARKAELVLEDYIRMMSSYRIKIIRDKENKVIGLDVNNRRIKQVIFKKTN